MEFGFLDFLKTIGALAFFIYGMKIMSEGMQKAAGSPLRNIIRTMTKTRFLGVFSGFFVTALLQSSSATSVMIVSFANTGFLTLIESISVIMGANIGTTITAWIISVFGFSVQVDTFVLPLMAISMPLLLINKAIFKNIGETLTGFAFLFLGLAYLKEVIPDLNDSPEVMAFLSSYTGYGIRSTLLFVGMGILLTVIVQSSGAAIAITLTLLFNGLITFEIAAAMVLGENIGTTISANLAALVGNVYAKRAALAHLIFNLIGAIWMVILFKPFIQLLQYVWEPFQATIQQGFPGLADERSAIQLSLFHTAFNLINTLLLAGFVRQIAKVVTYMVPSQGDEDEEFRLEYIGSSVQMPELSIIEAQKEAAKYGEITSKMSVFTQNLLESTDPKKQKKLLKKLKKYEENTDRLEIEITEFLTKISREDVSNEISVRVRSLMNICNDLERIGDIFYQMSKTIERKIEAKAWFNQHQRNRLNEMFELVNQAFSIMQDNLNAEHYNKVKKDAAMEAEKKINSLRNMLRKENVAHIESEDEYNINSAVVYSNLFSSLERVGDHIINVTESIVGEI